LLYIYCELYLNIAMCGISGFIDLKNSSSNSILQKMTDTLYHRGPDGSGYEFIKKKDYQIGLGHRRLSIIDLSETGKQPMQFEHLRITFNGEIYNYEEIRKELLGFKHQFIGQSDTEVILHAFIQWGVACVEKFIGPTGARTDIRISLASASFVTLVVHIFGSPRYLFPYSFFP